jgi:hypothetical protein
MGDAKSNGGREFRVICEGSFAGARLKVFLELYIAGILCLECKVLGLGSSSDMEINSAFQMGKMTVEIKVRE